MAQAPADKALADQPPADKTLADTVLTNETLADNSLVDETLTDALADKPRGRAGPKDRARVSRAARREVFARDGEQCSFVDAEGRRCSARGFLQIDHIDPRGRGGSGASKNLRILCQAHNRFAAEQIFGRKHIERAIHLRQHQQHQQPPALVRARQQPAQNQRKRPLSSQASAQARPRTQPRAQHRDGVGATRQTHEDTTTEKLITALTRLGFREHPARNALAQLRSATLLDQPEPSVPEQLRSAILLLTQ